LIGRWKGEPVKLQNEHEIACWVAVMAAQLATSAGYTEFDGATWSDGKRVTWSAGDADYAVRELRKRMPDITDDARGE